jgi:hypothetical protein
MYCFRLTVTISSEALVFFHNCKQRRNNFSGNERKKSIDIYSLGFDAMLSKIHFIKSITI